MGTSKKTTIDAEEVRQFESLGAAWWDESGPMKPLHQLGPVRMGYLKQRICGHFGRDDLKGLSVLDVGCGGGLVTEPLCRLGARVTGIDAGAENIKIARQHAAEQGLRIDYAAKPVEKTEGLFDVVTALEIVEHVSDPALFLASCARRVKKGGLLILSTLNRTPKSFALGIVAAEYVLGWVPRGTHDWKKFLKPSELAKPLEKADFTVTDVTGLVYHPLARRFALSETDLGVNYFLTAVRGS